MQALTREQIVDHLQEVHDLVRLYNEHDFAFATKTIDWLGKVETTLAHLRHPLVSLVAAERSKIIAVPDGLRDDEIDETVRSKRRIARAAASLALSRAEAALRAEVATIDARFSENRDQIAQLVAVTSGMQPIPLPEDGRTNRYLQDVWSLLGSNGDTRNMYGYLNAALKPADRLYLLGQVLDNFIGNVNGDQLSFAERFAALFSPLGIRSMAEVLEAGRTRSGRTKLADAAGVEPAEIMEWVNRADLMRIRGVGIEYADLLEYAGVDTIKELRTRNADNLAETLGAVNAQRSLVKRVPNAGTLAKWIDEAKQLKIVVRY